MYTRESHDANFTACSGMLDQCDSEIARLDELGTRATLTDARNLAMWLARRDSLLDLMNTWFRDKGC